VGDQDAAEILIVPDLKLAQIRLGGEYVAAMALVHVPPTSVSREVAAHTIGTGRRDWNHCSGIQLL
jgi:hypothetical protein